MALSAVRGRITARWAGVAVLILGVAAAGATPAGAAAGPGPAPTPRPASALLREAGVWRPADGSGAWGPLKAAAVSPASHRLPAPAAGQAAPGGPWRLQRNPPNPVMRNAILIADSCTGPGACIAVGGYENRAGTQIALAEARTGAGWRIQRTPVPAGAVLSNLFGVSCTAADACVAVGYYTDAALHTRPLVERWNGASWAIQSVPGPAGFPAAGFFAVSCASTRACTAVGAESSSTGATTPLAERWNGGQWRLQAFPRPPAAAQGGELSGVSCPTAGTCFATGWYSTKSGSAAFTAAWNGTRWQVQPAPGPAHASQLLGVSCTSPRACIAVGDHGTVVWNGTSWRYAAVAAPAGAEALVLNGVSCASAGACAAVGSYFGTAGGPLTLAETWNGTAWRFRPSPNPMAQGRNQLNTVSCTAPSACTAVGVDAASDFTPPGAFAETWDGTRWRLQPVPVPAGTVLAELFGVSCPVPGSCTAVGDTAGQSMIGVTLAMTTAGR